MGPRYLSPTVTAPPPTLPTTPSASKEWVIPAKPKPGRKPKKDAAAPKEANEVCRIMLPPFLLVLPSLLTFLRQVDNKGRRVQNRYVPQLVLELYILYQSFFSYVFRRAAQRAFRERKQSQLAELQARVLSYEQGEIERNVALQKISKHLKEENEQLKAENASLKEEIARLKDHVTTFSASATATLAQRDQDNNTKSLKRWRDESVCSILSEDINIVLESTSHKRPRAETISPAPSTTPASQYVQDVTYVPSPPSVVSSPGSNGVSRSPFSPLPFAPMPAPSGSSRVTGPQSASTMFCPSSGDSLKTFDVVGNAPPFDTFDCGLCTENTPCVCREIAMQTGIATALSGFGNDRIETQNGVMDVLKVEDTDKIVAGSAPSVIEIPSASEEIDSHSNAGARPSESSSSSLQHNMIPGQQANSTVPFQIRLPSPEPVVASNATGPSRSVPLRLKRARRSTSNKIWQVNPIAPTCSGDPSNCPACKDDDFGKAFCRALGDSASTTAPACASCPNPEACGKAPRSAYASGSGLTFKQDSTLGSNLKTIELTPMDSTQGAPILHSSNTDSERPSAKALSSSNFPDSISPPISQTFPSVTDGKTPKRSETIPANEAWARLKSHPNIAFADLRYVLSHSLIFGSVLNTTSIL